MSVHELTGLLYRGDEDLFGVAFECKALSCCPAQGDLGHCTALRIERHPLPVALSRAFALPVAEESDAAITDAISSISDDEHIPSPTTTG